MSAMDLLYSPADIGTLRIANRIVMAPMTRTSCPGGTPTAAVAEYYRRRAAGGAGLIITEATCIEHPAAQPYDNVPILYGEAALAGWRRVNEGVQAEGARIFSQLWHAGSTRQLGVGPDPTVPAYSPSGFASPGVQHGVAMSAKDIEIVIAAYAAAAANAKAVGFDGLELHGAHGYLIDQFLWAGVNQRTDGYGGAAANRLRFAVEVVEACRRAVGPDFPIVMRLSQFKQQDFSVRLWETPGEMEAALKPMVDAGVDAFHCSTRRFYEPGFEGDALTLAGWMRKLSGKPVIAVGSVGLTMDFLNPDHSKVAEFNEAETLGLQEVLVRMETGEFDFVAVGRAMIANPDWANLMRAGRLEALRGFKRDMLAELN